MAWPFRTVTAYLRVMEPRKLFELLAMMTIGACFWQVGSAVGLFALIGRLFEAHALANLALFSACVGIGAIVAVVRTSRQLRRAIAARIAAEEIAARAARQDPLTGLGNRRYFNEQLDARLADCRPDETLAVMLIDLDRFKPVNDMYGHAAGNAVLCAIAERLLEVPPPGSVVARLGGDEFVALIPDAAGEDEIGALAGRIIEAVRKPIPWRQGRLEVDATIGIAFAEPGTLDAEALLHAADLAMYQGKRQGRGVWRFYREDMRRALEARAELETDLRAAIAAGAILPYYQPIVSLGDRKVVGFEALARWQHPTRGLIEPKTFIPVADECGLISDLFQALLRKACKEARDWPGHLQLAVNLSPRQLQDPRTPEKILAVLVQTRFPADRLEVEVTESALVNDIDSARAVLASLQNLGAKIALDNFGAGYSTLHHLSELRFNKLKIDRSCVTELERGSERARLVDAILRLGSSLSVETTAEGIETDDNLQWLVDHGCAFGQGFLFGRAMPAAEADDLIRAEFPPPAVDAARPRLAVAARR